MDYEGECLILEEGMNAVVCKYHIANQDQFYLAGLLIKKPMLKQKRIKYLGKGVVYKQGDPVVIGKKRSLLHFWVILGDKN